jgi:hypothetical protein
MADAVATVGLTEKVTAPSEPEKPVEPKPAAKVKSVTTVKPQRDLTAAEIVELQKRGDMEMFAGVLGIEMENEQIETAKVDEILEKAEKV